MTVGLGKPDGGLGEDPGSTWSFVPLVAVTGQWPLLGRTKGFSMARNHLLFPAPSRTYDDAREKAQVCAQLSCQAPDAAHLGRCAVVQWLSESLSLKGGGWYPKVGANTYWQTRSLSSQLSGAGHTARPGLSQQLSTARPGFAAKRLIKHDDLFIFSPNRRRAHSTTRTEPAAVDRQAWPRGL